MTLELATTVTAILIIVTFIVWIAWDIFVFREYGSGPTESRTLRDWAYRVLALPLSFGVLGGHFFINTPANYDPPSIFILIAVGLAVAVKDVTRVIAGKMVRWYHVAGAFLFGIPTGILLFPQTIVN
jgi:hypothetical protein